MASLEQVEQAILVLYGNVRVRNLLGLSSLCIPALPSPRRSESVFKRFRGDPGTVWVPTSPPSNCSADYPPVQEGRAGRLVAFRVQLQLLQSTRCPSQQRNLRRQLRRRRANWLLSICIQGSEFRLHLIAWPSPLVMSFNCSQRVIHWFSKAVRQNFDSGKEQSAPREECNGSYRHSLPCRIE
jgi:hypothetical protein